MRHRLVRGGGGSMLLPQPLRPFGFAAARLSCTARAGGVAAACGGDGSVADQWAELPHDGLSEAGLRLLELAGNKDAPDPQACSRTPYLGLAACPSLPYSHQSRDGAVPAAPKDPPNNAPITPRSPPIKPRQRRHCSWRCSTCSGGF